MLNYGEKFPHNPLWIWLHICLISYFKLSTNFCENCFKKIDNLQIDNIQIDNRQIDNLNLQIDNRQIDNLKINFIS